MKNLEYYQKLPYRMEIVPEEPGHGFTVLFPELRGCITCVQNWDEIAEMAEDAKTEWLRAALEDGFPIPEPKSANEFSGEYKLRMPKSLHQRLMQRAKAEGVSMNQYCVYLLSQAFRNPVSGE